MRDLQFPPLFVNHDAFGQGVCSFRDDIQRIGNRAPMQGPLERASPNLVNDSDTVALERASPSPGKGF